MTIELDGTSYKFTGIGGKDHMKDYGTNVREEPCIVFGSDNLGFWLALLMKFEGLEDKTDMFDMSMKAILHGTMEDVAIEISGDAMLDLCIIGEAYLKMAGFDTLMDEDGTSMTLVSAK